MYVKNPDLDQPHSGTNLLSADPRQPSLPADPLARESFVAEIAHEISQPLFSILNYAKAVENALNDPSKLDLDTIRTWVRHIRNEASRGGEITQRIKSFSKTPHIRPELTELGPLISESIDVMALEAQDIGLAIEFNQDNSLPALNIDRVQIQQVLTNLLKNAIEAHIQQPAATPRVVVSTISHSSRVEVTVADNGPGLPTDGEMDFLEPFQTTKRNGLGLGLAISNSIIENHSGHLIYFPNEWGGVTFAFSLPTSS